MKTANLIRTACLPWATALLMPAGGCLDLLGSEEIVTESSQIQGKAQLEDDRIEDKHPRFDPARSVTESFGQFPSCDVTMNKSATVTKLEIASWLEGDDKSRAALQDKLFRGRGEAIAAVGALAETDLIPSMEVVNGTLKPFNDGLYAAVELQVEPEKQALLSTLLSRLTSLAASAEVGSRPAFENAAVFIGAALILGGDPAPLDPAIEARAAERARAFAEEPLFSRPIGFYTWSPALGRIFTRDRLLQGRDGDATSFGALAAVAFVLGQDPALLAAYQKWAGLYAGLTNPYRKYTLDALIPYATTTAALADPAAIESGFGANHPRLEHCGGTSLVGFLPASRSKEDDYFDELFCAKGVPQGANLLDVLVEGIRTGDVALDPDPTSGWYDHQLYALETLLLPDRAPEAQHLLLTAGYKKKLIDTFKSLLIQNRETHVKQLGGATSGSVTQVPVDLYPLLRAEPFPTFYLRTARGYRFLRTFLQAALGPDFLASNARVLESGARAAGTPLAQELDRRVHLLYGLTFLSADTLGLAREAGLMPNELAEIEVAAAVETAQAWLSGWRSDTDVTRDPRVIIPIRYQNDGAAYYLAVIGVKAVQARASFVPGHEPIVEPNSCWTGKFVPRAYTLLVEETAQVFLPRGRKPPTRDELRAICDAHSSKADIISALEKP